MGEALTAPATSDLQMSLAHLLPLLPVAPCLTFFSQSACTLRECKTERERERPDHLTCLLRNLYAGQEATVRAGHGTTYWFQIEKGVRQGCILSLCLFNFYASCEMLGWMKHKLISRLLGELSITSDMQMTPPLWQKAKT